MQGFAAEGNQRREQGKHPDGDIQEGEAVAAEQQEGADHERRADEQPNAVNAVVEFLLLNRGFRLLEVLFVHHIGDEKGRRAEQVEPGAEPRDH